MMEIEFYFHGNLHLHSVIWTSAVMLLSVFVIVDVSSDSDDILRTRRWHPGFSNSSMCGDVFREETGTIVSPCPQCWLPRNGSCAFYISSPPGNALWIQFTEIDLQPPEDCETRRILVYDGLDVTSPMITTICPSHRPPISFTSEGPQVLIVFQSDFHQEQSTFRAEYFTFDVAELIRPKFNTYSVCEENVGMALNGIVRSHRSYPSNSYQTNAYCKLLLIPVESSRGFHIEFSDISVNTSADCSTVQDEEQCTNEWVSVRQFSPTTATSEKLCGLDKKRLFIESRGLPILFEFYANTHNSSSYTGFSANFSQSFTRPTNTVKGHCGRDQFECVNSEPRLCIPLQVLCNDIVDCPDSTDELYCDGIKDNFLHFHGKALSGEVNLAIIVGIMLGSIVIMALPYFYYRKYVVGQTQPLPTESTYSDLEDTRFLDNSPTRHV
ncbi:CUB and zona pellucida-like domain-containing protein 1 [Ptychodera flava]|uniref:CUB and zona pellucida-like domain-containing protein 1 n=1 Tax=Ptychodera flava TaxID=63121 RepID=UPI00396A86B3